ncbi:Glutaredoxin-2 [Leminorella richardii]|uniref:Glutaredoxin-2 n=1 Tax=Leminorella richardii TaxID=158841 RepID=A0A2X4XQS6_9GAMM|nr:glutaredoxin 2 [Leminorella richardii]SQI42295.1 Glutaredoxin-2 [Leminorella richardii]
MKLYVYDHCPYCVKARMIFGLKNIPFEMVTLLNDDEETPVRMIGQKMAPILEKDDGSFMPESMDIVHYVDKEFGTLAITGSANPAVANWLKEVSAYLNHLLIPRYAKAEFSEFSTPSSRAYFAKKKEAAIGSFEQHLNNTPALKAQLEEDLLKLDALIQSPEACNGELSVDDIHLFPALRGMSIVKDVHYPTRVDAYRKTMSKRSGVNLLDSIAQ